MSPAVTKKETPARILETNPGLDGRVNSKTL